MIIYNTSDIVVIGTVESIYGVINYNGKEKTIKDGLVININKARFSNGIIGKLKIDKVLKGTITDEGVIFIKSGDIISVKEYEEKYQENEKINTLVNKLTEQEKHNKYVMNLIEYDIPIEKGKMYLMYLKYDKELGGYSIMYFQYGLREIDSQLLNSDIEKLTLDEYKSIKVKNNKTGELEKLEDIVAESVVKNI